MIDPNVGERFKFDQQHCRIYDLQTKKFYEVLYDERGGNEEITKICIEILQTMDKINPIHSRLNNLQKDVVITKSGVKLATNDTIKFDEKTKFVFFQKLSEIFVKIPENKPIRIREIRDPKFVDDLNIFFKKSNYDHEKINQLINFVKNIEIYERAFLNNRNPEVAKLTNYKNRILELSTILDDLSQDHAELTAEKYGELAHFASSELKNLQILLILSLIQYSLQQTKKSSIRDYFSLSAIIKQQLPIQLPHQKDLLNHLSRAMKMHAFKEESSILDLPSVRSFIRQSALNELPLLEEIEQAKLHVFSLKSRLKGSVDNPKTLRLRHELKFTEMFLLSKERKILSKMRQKVIDSIPKNRKLKNEEIATLIEIDLRSAELSKQIDGINEMRKELKKEHVIAVKEGVIPLENNLLKVSALESDFANAILQLNPKELISSSESWEPVKEAKETSFGASVYNAVKNGLQKAQSFVRTSSALKAIRDDLRKQIDEKYREIKEIESNHQLIGSVQKANINKIEKEIKVLENKIHFVNLQRYNNEIVKITDELGFLNYFVQASHKAIAVKEKDLQAEEIKLKLYQLLLKTPETEDKNSWLDAKALNISKSDLTILENISIKLPKNNQAEREKVLKQYIIEAEKRKGELHYSIGIAKQEILKAEHRKIGLDLRFRPIMNKYEADWEGVRSENALGTLAAWAKDTFLKSISFGMITNPAPPHPAKLRMKKEYADLGYNFYSVMEEWKDELDKLPQAAKQVYYKQMMEEFYEWARTHPATATQLAGDIALSLSVINPNKAFVDHLLTPLQAKSFAYTMLQEVGIKDVPTTKKDKKFLRFKALADLCRYMPHVTGSLESLATATQNTLTGAAIAGPFGAFLGIIGGVTNVALNTLKTTLIQDQVDRIQGKDSANILFMGRIVRKMVQSSPYVDAAVEQNSMKIAKDAIIAVNAIKRPGEILPYLASKVSYWWKQVKTAPTGLEKIIRLSPAIAVGGTIGLGILAIAVGGPYIIPLAIGAATLILPFLFFYHRYSPDLDNTFFPNTQVVIKMNELEKAIKKKDDFFKETAKRYADSLVKKRTLPSKELIPVPEHYEELLKAMKPNDTRLIQQIQNEYTEKLNQKMAELQKVKADHFEANWKAKKRAAGPLSKVTDLEWIEKQKVQDFKNFGKDYCRSPMMRDIVIAFTKIVEMKEVRDAVEKEVDAYIETIQNGKQNFAQIKQTLIENRARQIMSNLVETWLKTELVSGAKEQFRAFYMTYNDEYATQDVDNMLNKLREAKQKENHEALEKELQNDLPFGAKAQDIAEEIDLIRSSLTSSNDA